MVRKIIKIDESLCNGCGLCVNACHEGAIGMVEGKAKLLSEHYCDGLGDCLPACPAGAITFEEREAASYDEAAVKARKAAKLRTRVRPGSAGRDAGGGAPVLSRLTQWPVQIKLVPVRAPYFDGADLLIAADCTAYAYGNFHGDFMAGRAVLVGCPKLDAVNYGEKLTEIFAQNEIRSITVVRMEVPCCGGMAYAVQNALAACGKAIPCEVVTIKTGGEILKRERVMTP